MAIEVVYRVKKPNGELAGEYMDKKQADAHDQKLDCIYTIVDLIQSECDQLEDSVSEQIAECMVDNRQLLMASLKKVKDAPAAKPGEEGGMDSSAEDEKVTPIKQVNS